MSKVLLVFAVAVAVLIVSGAVGGYIARRRKLCTICWDCGHTANEHVGRLP